MSKPPRCPSPAVLAELGNAAQDLARALRDYYPLDGATPEQNPARLTAPSGDTDETELMKQGLVYLLKVGTVHKRLRGLLDEVDPGELMDDAPSELRGLLPKKTPTEKMVKGWPVDAKIAVARIHEVSSRVVDAVEGGFQPVPIRDVERLEHAGKACQEAAEATPQTKKRPWTQKELDKEIEDYKAKRSHNYHELVERVAKGDKGAKKAARKMFGRNAVVRALGVKSPDMVSKSPAWRGIAKALDLEKPTKRPDKIGHDMAVERASEDRSVPADEAAIRRETIGLIERAMPKKEAQATIDRLERGEMSDDEARELIDVVEQQQTDNRSRKAL